jgi:hypothetical protein
MRKFKHITGKRALVNPMLNNAYIDAILYVERHAEIPVV